MAEVEVFRPPAQGQSLGVIVGGTSYVDARTGKLHGTLDLMDLDRNELARIPLDFLAHGFTVHPQKPHLAAVFEKRGPGAALVDLSACKLLGYIRTRHQREFYGHGLWSSDGRIVYAVETALDTHAGLMVVRDANGFAELDTFPTYGENPHDCLFVDGGKTLVVTNGGGDLGSSHVPSVTYVDVASRRLLEKVVFSDPKINAGHAVIARDGSLAVCSAPRDGLPQDTSLGGVTIKPRKGKAERMRKPRPVVERMLGESLSLALHEKSGGLAVTNPAGGIVTLWDMRTGRLLRSVDVEAPRGVTLTLDERWFVLASGKLSRLTLVSTKTLEPIQGAPEYEARCFSGSHIYNWKRPAQAA